MENNNTLNRLVKYKNINFTLIESLEGDINKSFDVINGVITKTANANIRYADLTVYNTTSLTALISFFNNLKPNQCIISGIPKNDMTTATIVPEYDESTGKNYISRKNKNFTYSKDATLILIDQDANKDGKLNVTDAIDLEKKMNILIPELEQCEHFINPSSSSRVYNKQTNTSANNQQNNHYWFPACNVNDKNINNFIEYLKRKSWQVGLAELKIFKNSAVGDRYIWDAMPIKLLKSGLKFEANPTIKSDSLELREIGSLPFNENSNIAVDLSSFNPDELPDWRPLFNQEKKKQENLIKKQKKTYTNQKLEELIASGYKEEIARSIINKHVEEQVIPVKFFVDNGNGLKSLITYLLNLNDEIPIVNVIEPEKGMGNTILYTNHIFNARIMTFKHGGMKFNLYFELDDISYIIELFKTDINKFEFILDSLINYLISNSATKGFVKNISDLIKDEEKKEYFQEKFDNKYLESKALKVLETYAVLVLSGKVLLLNTINNDLDVLSIPDARNLFANKKEKGYFSKKSFNLVDYYISSPKRKDYTKVVFKDPKLQKEDEYNLFDKWPYEVKEMVSTEFFWNFVLVVIANNNIEVFTYIKAWMSQIIQDPFSKIGTALCINGVPGSGKSFFIKTFGSLFGKFFMATSNPKYIFGSFNSQLLNKILIYANESFWSGNKSDASKLKALITEIPCVIEQKGLPAFEAENYAHLILDTNDFFITHVEKNDRRLNLITSSDEKVGDADFFNELHIKTETDDFKSSLLFDLMNHEYKHMLPQLRKAIITDTTIEQIMYSLSPDEQWFHSLLQEGRISNMDYLINEDGTLQIANETMHTSYVDFCTKNKQRYQKYPAAFGSEISKKFFSGKLTVKQSCKYKNKNAKIYATLKELRQHFTNEYLIKFDEDQMNDSWQYDNQIPIGQHTNSIPAQINNNYGNTLLIEKKPY